MSSVRGHFSSVWGHSSSVWGVSPQTRRVSPQHGAAPCPPGAPQPACRHLSRAAPRAVWWCQRWLCSLPPCQGVVCVPEESKVSSGAGDSLGRQCPGRGRGEQWQRGRLHALSQLPAGPWGPGSIPMSAGSPPVTAHPHLTSTSDFRAPGQIRLIYLSVPHACTAGGR